MGTALIAATDLQRLVFLQSRPLRPVFELRLDSSRYLLSLQLYSDARQNVRLKGHDHQATSSSGATFQV